MARWAWLCRGGALVLYSAQSDDEGAEHDDTPEFDGVRWKSLGHPTKRPLLLHLRFYIRNLVPTLCRVSNIISHWIDWLFGLNYILLWWWWWWWKWCHIRRRRLSISDFHQSIGRRIWQLLCEIKSQSESAPGKAPSSFVRTDTSASVHPFVRRLVPVMFGSLLLLNYYYHSFNITSPISGG